MLFDSHAHVAVSEFDSDRTDVITRAREAGLVGWLEVGTDLEQSKKALALAEAEKGVVASVGVHPHDYESLTDEVWTEIEGLLKHPLVVAIGEVGFDFYRGGTPEAQRPVVQQWIGLAQKLQKPIVWHVRDGDEYNAHDALLRELEGANPIPAGVIHTYSGTREQAERYLALGQYISISGVVTFKNAGELPAVVQAVPLEKLLIETDAPFLAPTPYRGKRNEPAYIAFVAKRVAELKGVAAAHVAERTGHAAKKLFGIA